MSTSVPPGYDDVIVIGDARTLRFVVGENLTGLAGALWRLAAWDGLEGFRGAALAERTLGQGIEIVGEGADTLDVAWKGPDTDALARGDYVYHLRIVDAGGQPYTVRSGRILCLPFPPAAS